MKKRFLSKVPLIIMMVTIIVLYAIQSVNASQYKYAIMNKGDGEAITDLITLGEYKYDFYLRGMCYTGNILCCAGYYDKESGKWLEFPGTRFYLSAAAEREQYCNISGHAKYIRGVITKDSFFGWSDSGSVAVRTEY